MSDIVSIARVVEVVNGEEDEENEETLELETGLYAIDSHGTIWKRMDSMTDLFRALVP